MRKVLLDRCAKFCVSSPQRSTKAEPKQTRQASLKVIGSAARVQRKGYGESSRGAKAGAAQQQAVETVGHPWQRSQWA